MKTSLLISFFFLPFFCIAQNHVHFVSPTGAYRATGLINDPFKSIQAAVNASKQFDTVVIEAGTYRESINVSGAEKKGLYITAAPNQRPELKGSDVMSGWSKENSYWKKLVKIQPQQVMVNGDHPLQQIGYPNNDFKVNQSYPRYKFPVGTDLSDMEPGRFYWENGMLYIWLSNSGDPNNTTIEVSQRPRILTVNSDSVTVKGLLFEHTNVNTFAEQGVGVALGNHTLMQYCQANWCDFGGIAMASNSRVYNCECSHNGSFGFGASEAFNFLISHCKANYNNYRNFYAQWHAGGFKGATSSWGTIERSEFAYNIGSGIWFDYCFYQDKYRKDGPKPINVLNNYIHHNSLTSNKNSALMLEMTEDVTIEKNLITHNDYRAIYLSASWNDRILDNTIAYNIGFFAVDLAGLPRAGENRAKLMNNLIQGNTIINNSVAVDLEILPGNGTNISGNVSDNNSFFRDHGEITLKSGSVYHNVADWSRATKNDIQSVLKKPQGVNLNFAE